MNKILFIDDDYELSPLINFVYRFCDTKMTQSYLQENV